MSLELPPTNFDKWQYFMKDCTAPQSYISFGFYYLIAAALQRRVWTGDLTHKPLFPNIYVIMVGKPGLGKDLVIEPVENILREHKIDNVVVAEREREQIKELATEKDAKGKYKDLKAEDLLEGKHGEDLARKIEKARERPLVIPLAANATTYEALVDAMAKSTRRIRRLEWSEKEQKNIVIPYSHCSLGFCLGEISSLFRAKTQNVVNFLLEAYNCKDNYDYNTIGRGECSIRKLCLNFLGGTTPGFMESVFDDAILNEGFSSRTWFLFEAENRFNRMFIDHLSPEQVACRSALVEHTRLLTKVCGPLFYTTEAKAWLKNWWEIEVGERKTKENTSPKLESYYSRKQIHIQKMAMILHFSELSILEPKDDSQDMCWSNQIEVTTCEKALAILNSIEAKMHLALTFGGQNPLYKTGQKVQRFLAKHPEGVPFHSILAEHFEYANKDELQQIIEMLVATEKIESFNKEHETMPGKIIGVYFRLVDKPKEKSSLIEIKKEEVETERKVIGL